MTYMPKYTQSATEQSYEYHAPGDAELLKERSRENLSRLLINYNLAAAEPAYTTRLEAELQILEEKQFSGYFLIVADYVNWARDNGIAVGPGRGSGPCSLVGFTMGITTVDPIKYDLPFERFINPDRESLPNFDLEFCAERYGEVSNYIQAKYGADRVAQISSHDTTPLPSRLVICDRPLTEVAPVYSNSVSGFSVTRMTAAQVADAGLVQFNVINQKALTVIQRTVNNLTTLGVVIDINNIALDDKAAYRLLSAGEISNISVLDGDHYKSALIAVQPDRFENLCAVIAFCYPLLRDYIPLFAERSKRPELIHHFHPALKSITAETFGLIIYQEQIMHIAQKIAGFSLAQGDSLRRALKNSNSNTVKTYKNKFIDGAMNFDLTKAEAKNLFEHIAISGQRCFNKSHAVAFAMTAYQIAWLKTNYLREYSNATNHQSTS